MKKVFAATLITLLIVSFAFAAATKKGLPNEAKAMVEKAVALMKASGNEKAFAEFNNPKGQFIDRDLYIYVVDADKNGLCYAHGANEKLIGKELIELKDSDGKPLIQNIVNEAKAKGNGWSDYKWQNPVSKQIEAKTCYFQKVNNLVVCCGAYK
jgi:cytochrome c